MATLLQTPQNAVTIRMYRQGHGDCFLLAFPRQVNQAPFYVLIDCGLKPGSQDFIHPDGAGGFKAGPTIEQVVKHIGESTNYHLNLVILTHEHQDHLNCIWKQNDPFFADFKVDKAWVAWTENGEDELANTLRKSHGDQLLSLIEARELLALAAGENDPAVHRLDTLLSLEIGTHEEVVNQQAMLAAAGDPEKSGNKQGLKLIKDKATQNQGVEYLNPGDKRKIPATDAGVEVYVFGPPRSESLLLDENPDNNEEFPNIAAGVQGLSFLDAAKTAPSSISSPFADRFHLKFNEKKLSPFVMDHYGKGKHGEDDSDNIEVTSNAPWRRIDNDWLHTAENLALKLTSGINNTSLVLAFELPVSKKVLFFAADAQRGNWISWSKLSWETDGQRVTARDLLGRTVLYKVGHHGSHNATLNGKLNEDHPSLSWMGQGRFGGEFTAMITAVNKWAMTNTPPWRHPLPSIRKALEQKTNGRLFQTDTKPVKPQGMSEAEWKVFTDRAVFNDLYFDYTIQDLQ